MFHTDRNDRWGVGWAIYCPRGLTISKTAIGWAFQPTTLPAALIKSIVFRQPETKFNERSEVKIIFCRYGGLETHPTAFQVAQKTRGQQVAHPTEPLHGKCFQAA